MTIDEERGADNSHPRLYFLDEHLEITTTSRRHENLSEWLSDLLSDYVLELDTEVFPCGQATLQKVNQAGAEPHKSWCLGEEKVFPDIALEIALTSGGLNKLAICSLRLTLKFSSTYSLKSVIFACMQTQKQVGNA